MKSAVVPPAMNNGDVGQDFKSRCEGQMKSIVFNLDMWTFGILCIIFPVSTLVLCFVTGFVYRFEEVNETMCGVKNYIPSISAVTGITPQTYFWRTSIALQAAPRISVCFFYYNFYKNRLHQVATRKLGWYKGFMRLNFYLNFVENCCLLLVAFINNRENYPVHEKIFVIFMVSSLCYMLTNTILFKWSIEGHSTEIDNRSYWWKKAMFALSMTFTAGLIFFFIQHRFFCVHGAFSWFSFCEYFIAFGNMFYHFSACLDFKDLSVVVGNFKTTGETDSNGKEPLAVNNNLGSKTKSH